MAEYKDGDEFTPDVVEGILDFFTVECDLALWPQIRADITNVVLQAYDGVCAMKVCRMHVNLKEELPEPKAEPGPPPLADDVEGEPHAKLEPPKIEPIPPPLVEPCPYIGLPEDMLRVLLRRRDAALQTMTKRFDRARKQSERFRKKWGTVKSSHRKGERAPPDAYHQGKTNRNRCLQCRSVN